MQITRLHIQKYRILNHIDLNFTSNEIYMIGKNGSGKSTVLEAIAEIFAYIYSQIGGFTIQRPQFEYSIEYRINGHQVAWSSDDSIELDGEMVRLGRFRNENDTYRLIPNNVFLYYAGITDRLKTVSNKFLSRYRNQLAQWSGSEDQEPMPVPSPFIYADGSELDITMAALLANGNKQIRDKLQLINDIRIYLRITLRKPSKVHAKDVSNVDLWGERSAMVLSFIEGLIGISEENDLSSNEKITFLIESLSLASFANSFENKGRYVYQVLEYLRFRKLLDKIEVYWNLENDDTVNITYLSEGEKQAILASGAVDLWGNNDTLLLLDEPDTFLHPTWQNDFVSEVARNLGSNQLFVTTHSSLMLSSVLNGQIFSVVEGHVDNWGRRTFGMDSSSILTIVMDSDQRDKYAQKMQTQIMDCCYKRDWDEAKKLLADYEELADVNSGEVMRMKAFIHRMEKIAR